jgi:hypothetical protein
VNSSFAQLLRVLLINAKIHQHRLSRSKGLSR